jgi:putative salt-induced outer membrane protein YdiY
VSARRLGSGIALVLWIISRPAPAAAFGHGKVDRIEKKNGDVLIAEVVGLARGMLKAKTDGMGTVDIEWNQVTRLASPAIFEVELSSGFRYFGTLASPALGQLTVSGGPAGAVFDMVTVVRLTPIDQTYWGQLDGSIDFGYTFTQADQRSQWSLNAKISRTTAQYVTSAGFGAVLTVEDAGTHQNRNTTTIGVERQLRNRWFALFFGQFDHNEELGLDLRVLGGGGIGRKIVQTNRFIFAPYGGASYAQERYSGEPTDNIAEAIAGMRADWFTFGDYKTDLIFQEQTFFDIQNADRIRIELQHTFKQEIAKDLYWSLNLLESFNTKPPDNQKKNDLTLSMTLGWSF